MVKVTGLHGIGGDNVEAVYVKIYCPNTLALYLMGSIIGVKSSQKLCF